MTDTDKQNCHDMFCSLRGKNDKSSCRETIYQFS